MTEVAVSSPEASAVNRASGSISVIWMSVWQRDSRRMVKTFLGRSAGSWGMSGQDRAMLASLYSWASVAMSCHGRVRLRPPFGGISTSQDAA